MPRTFDPTQLLRRLTRRIGHHLVDQVSSVEFIEYTELIFAKRNEGHGVLSDLDI